jgi:hypothetical protein
MTEEKNRVKVKDEDQNKKTRKRKSSLRIRSTGMGKSRMVKKKEILRTWIRIQHPLCTLTPHLKSSHVPQHFPLLVVALLTSLIW